MSSTLATLQAARDAVLFALPLYEMSRMRAATAQRVHPQRGPASDQRGSPLRWCNLFTHSRRLVGPQDRRVVSPNNDTLYTDNWLDLSHGPLVLDVPDMGERYWTLGFLDMWTNPFAHAGRRTTGNRAQKIFVHGPSWRGTVPEGHVQIAAPGDDVWVLGRILVDPDEADIERVKALQDAFSVRTAAGGDPARIFDPGLEGRKTEVPQAEEFRRVVRAAWRRNPPPAAHGAMSRTSAAFSLDGTAQEDPSEAHEDLLAQALVEVCTELRDGAQGSDVGGGWSIPVLVRTGYGEDFALRARVARNLIGALGMEEAMYVLAEVDAQGAPLDGTNAYELRFAPEQLPQVDAFWSITMYRKSDCMLVDNPIGRYSIGDRTAGLARGEDGSLCIRLQCHDPGTGLNWLPAPAEPFYLVLRLYQPGRAHTELAFDYPPVRATRRA